jgi:hypothetical protein
MQHQLPVARPATQVCRRCQVPQDDQGIAAAALDQAPEIIGGYRDVLPPGKFGTIVAAQAGQLD